MAVLTVPEACFSWQKSRSKWFLKLATTVLIQTAELTLATTALVLTTELTLATTALITTISDL